MSAELGVDLGLGAGRRRLAMLDGTEHEAGRLPGADVEAGADVAAVDDLQRLARREAEGEIRGAEERAVRGQRDLVTGARVVEAGGDLDREAHLAAHGEHAADDALAVRRLARARRHEVVHLPHPVGRQEAGDEDVGVGKVELLRGPALALGLDAEAAAAVGVEERGEDAWRIDAPRAVPVDRAVGADQGDGVQVADQAVLGDSAGSAPSASRPPAHGTSTSLPFAAALSSISWAWRASDSGRRSATTGWILPSRSRSSMTPKSSRNHSG